jgi:threonine aldolase
LARRLVVDARFRPWRWKTATMQLPQPPARSFASDNAAGVHPAVLEALADANAGHALAYGEDRHTAECTARFCDLFGADVAVDLTFNGTGANIVALATILGSLPGPHHAVVCTNWAHIHVDETGAPERILGTKLIDIETDDAKLTPAHLASVAPFQGNTHHVQPGVVSITQPTELGTLYLPAEVAALCETAHEMGLLVHLDGARIANATAALGADVAALRSFTIDAGVDVVSFGGTKNGLLGAEAVVFCNTDVATGAQYVRKQTTQLASKMRFLAAQFNAILHENLWIELAKHSNTMAANLYDATSPIPGVEIATPPAVNSIFPCLPPGIARELREWCFFWDWDTSRNQVRWMTAWDTTDDDISTFAAGVRQALER